MLNGCSDNQNVLNTGIHSQQGRLGTRKRKAAYTSKIDKDIVCFSH